MAKIVEYDAKDAKLTPSNEGYSAAETAARRIGQFSEQMAQGTREVGNLQRELDDDTGKGITAFLRFKGLEDAENTINVKVKPGDNRSLIGTGNAGNPNYARLNELANGPAHLSRMAAGLVAANSPIKDDVENGVNILRGGADQGKSDIENGVTVFRGGTPLPTSGDLLTKGPAVGDQLAPYGIIPSTTPDDVNGGFPLPINRDDQLPAAGSLSDANNLPEGTAANPRYPVHWYDPSTWNNGPQSQGPSATATVQPSIPIEQDNAPSLWGDLQENQ